MLQLNLLRHDIFHTEQSLRAIERTDGRTSAAFRAGQLKLLRLWALMRMMHREEDFIGEILSAAD